MTNSVKAALVVALLMASASVYGQSPAPSPAQSPAHPPEPNAALMECTFMLEGRTLQGQSTLGTAFVMGRPVPGAGALSKYVLITAAHVLEGMAGDSAVLHFRREVGPNDFQALPIMLPIRSAGKPLWTRDPNGDVAVMYVTLPTGVTLPLVSTNLLADDQTLEKYEVHPGDELECLGYPLGLSANDAGFPILRSGMIASFPLLPTSSTKTFLLDFHVFQGNSGGPVYFVATDRMYGESLHLGETDFLIAGLVSEEKLFQQTSGGPYDQEIHEVQLGLAVVVHASLIKEAIEMLPVPTVP